MRESRKDQPAYKRAALACLGNILESYERDYFSQVWEIVMPHLSKVSHPVSGAVVGCSCWIRDFCVLLLML